MAKDKIEIEVLAKGVKEAQADVEKLKKQINNTGETTKKSGVSMVASFAAIAGGAAAAFAVIKKGINLSREFSKFDQSVKAMESQFGVSADKIIKKLSEVSKGTISNADLVTAANKAMSLNVTKDVDQMAQLMEVARIRGQAMGLDTTQAFNDIVTGIGRGSPLILDNLGIITKGWAEEAQATGKTMDAQFILNKVLADGADLLKKTGDVALTAAERYQKFEAESKNLSIAIGGELQNEFTKIFDSFEDLSGGGSPINIVIRALRVLIALTRVVALTFTTMGRISALVLTPLAVAVGSIIKGFVSARKAIIKTLEAFRDFDPKHPIESLKKIGGAGKDALETIADDLMAIPGRIKDGTKKQLELMKGEYQAAGDSIKNIFADVGTQVGKGEQALTENAKKESDKRVEITRDEIRRRQQVLNGFQSAVSSFADSLIEIEQDKLDRMDENDTKARNKQKKKLYDLAIIQKVIAGINAGINTAEAITKALTIDPTGILAAAVGAAGGLEIAAIASTKIPAFRQGTQFSPGGRSLVGESGPEILNLPQGSQVIPNSITNNSEQIDNRNININVTSNNAIDLVNQLKQTYGVDVFGR